MPLRVSTNSFYQQGSESISDNMAALQNLQVQIGSGLKIQSPEDDPIGAARLLSLQYENQLTDQYLRNANAATSKLGQEELTLGSVEAALRNISSLAIQANSSALSRDNRAAITEQLEQRLYELASYANTQYDGEYIFSGNRSTKPAVIQQSDGSFVYSGDAGVQQVQIAGQSYVGTNHTGLETFFDIQSGKINANSFSGRATHTSAASGLVNSGTLGTITSNSLVLNTITIENASTDGVSTTDASASAIAIANAINASITDHHITATANTNTVALGAITAGVLVAGNLTINGVQIIDASSTNQGIVDAINLQTTTTGVTATLNAGAVSLSAADGRNIQIQTNGTAAAATFANVSLTDTVVKNLAQRATVSLSSYKSFDLAGLNPTTAGFTTGTYAVTANGGTAELSELLLVGEPPLANLSKQNEIYRIVFNSSSTYSIYSASNPNTPLTGFDNVAYTSGDLIKFEPNSATENLTDTSIELKLSGTPNTGDVFFVELKKQPKQDMFSTIKDLIEGINTYGGDVNHPTKIGYEIGIAIKNLNNILQHVSNKRAEVGSRQNFISSQVKSNKSFQLLAQKGISSLQDLDYAEAISLFLKQQFAFEAAQQSFMRIQELSLVNYLR
ncbi:MAG: flagellar hook-associated protein FlgL [Gammaproteobacteria bacterium]